MDALSHAVVIVAVLGSGLIGGVFFAFSSFVMPALARLPKREGMAAMRSINVVVLNKSFLGVFIGTAVVSVAASVLVLVLRGSGAPFVAGGAICYVVGTFMVTGLRNVPLNDRLAEAGDGDAGATEWDHYLRQWTAWNHVRTAAAIVAALLFTLSLR